MLLQIVRERLAHGCGHHTCHLRVAQLGLGLSLELRLCHLHGDNRRQALAEVVGVDGRVAVLVFQFGFLQQFAVLGVLLHHTCERSAEACHVSTALYCVDIVHVRVYVLVEVGVVNHRHLHGRAVLLGAEVNHLRDKRRAGAVDIAHKLAQALLRIEHLALVTFAVSGYHACLVSRHFALRQRLGLCSDGVTLVRQGYLHACVQVCQLAHTVGENIILVNGLGEDTAVGPELHEGTRATFAAVSAYLMHGTGGLALGVLLHINLAVAIDLYVHLGG